jgi:superfamily II DNA/RNA helicase
MQSGGELPEVDDATRDGYSTLLYYFNSLRELGGAIVQILDDVPDSIALYASARKEKARDIPHSEEMTSRKSQDEILRILEELKKTCDQEYPVDAVLATNMVSVGVDISRLGLMLVNGQPKTRAEYIQATSRVGRSNHPGLIVTVLNAAKPRDRSHYETFQTWHSAIYKDVEATSVTPFAPRARDRALKAVLVTMLRQGISSLSTNPVDPSLMPSGQLAQIVAEIERRVNSVSPTEVESVQKEVDEALFDWERRKPTHYENRAKPLKALIQRAEEYARKIALHRTANPGWPVMNSMRTVEPSTPFRLAEKLSSSGLVGRGNGTTDDGERQVPPWRMKNGEQ